MKRKIFAAIMFLTISGVTVPMTGCLQVMAQAAEESQETPDFAMLAGVWTSQDDSEETLTLTEDGLFVYHKAAGDTQGYMEYVEEYNDGNGRYDMYNRIGAWVAGFYLDSDTSLHMGNTDGAVFNKTEDVEDDQEAAEEENGPSYVLTSSKRYTGLKHLYNDTSWNGGYFYYYMTEDGMTVIVNCCARNDETGSQDSEEARKQFAALVSDWPIENYKETKSKKFTKKFSYPVYRLTFTTGSNEDTCQWKMLYFQTDTNTYAYAYKMDIDWADEMKGEYKDALNSLELTDISGTGTGENGSDYDPSAEGQSLEMFIAYFDSWYQYGDLNAMSIHLYGEGTWEIYNSRNTDGSGGYLFDSGTFQTSGTTALQLFSTDGSHVANVSLDGNGELLISPLIPGYGNIYAGAAFSRESDSVAYEAQIGGDGMGEDNPDNGYDYEEDGVGDYIPDEDYVEESDPGDTYYWYDGEGNVMYFNGYENLYMGPDDVFYIDDAGRLCEY